jgi:hypothetical protein
MSARLDIPFVDELAADIFMGEFSGKFVESACRAADLLQGTIYAAYYGIDYAKIREIPKPVEPKKQRWFWPQTKVGGNEFADLCAHRAGVSLGTWKPAISGMIIEQQQIITTQNLAALFAELKLADTLRDQLGEMAKRCFEWVCKRQQIREANRHAQLKVLKNTAYAWRQMIFFLSLISERDVADFLRWAEEYLVAQEEGFRTRFLPALRGLISVVNGVPIDQSSESNSSARRFLGWAHTGHWLMADVQSQ